MKKIMILIIVVFGMFVLGGCGMFDDAGKDYVGRWEGKGQIVDKSQLIVVIDIAKVKDTSYEVKIKILDGKNIIQSSDNAAKLKDGSLYFDSPGYVITVQKGVMKLSWDNAVLTRVNN